VRGKWESERKVEKAGVGKGGDSVAHLGSIKDGGRRPGHTMQKRDARVASPGP